MSEANQTLVFDTYENAGKMPQDEVKALIAGLEPLATDNSKDAPKDSNTSCSEWQRLAQAAPEELAVSLMRLIQRHGLDAAKRMIDEACSTGVEADAWAGREVYDAPPQNAENNENEVETFTGVKVCAAEQANFPPYMEEEKEVSSSYCTESFPPMEHEPRQWTEPDEPQTEKPEPLCMIEHAPDDADPFADEEPTPHAKGEPLDVDDWHKRAMQKELPYGADIALPVESAEDRCSDLNMRVLRYVGRFRDATAQGDEALAQDALRLLCRCRTVYHEWQEPSQRPQIAA